MAFSRTTQLPQRHQNNTSADQGKLFLFKPFATSFFSAFLEPFSYILLKGSQRNAKQWNPNIKISRYVKGVVRLYRYI